MSAESTVEVILDGAARALGRHGARKLSMSDICQEARVSRGTLYRYFASKEDVLEALSQHVLAGVQTALEQAVAARPGLDCRVRVVLETLYDLGENAPYAARMVEAEPGFALAFFSRSMPTYVSILDEFVAPALHDVPAVVEGRLTTAQVSELLERLVLSTWLLRVPGDGRVLERVAATWDALVRSAEPGQRTPLRAVRDPGQLAGDTVPERRDRRTASARAVRSLG